MRRLVPFALLLAACDLGEDNLSTFESHLMPLGSCGEAADYIKQVAIDKMNKTIDESIASYENGEGCYRGYGEGDASSGAGGGGTQTPPSPAPTTGTGTNNQVSGVDEADFIKNDGQYIYLAQNGKLRIVDAWPADQAHTVSVTALEGTPRKLFVDGDKALVYTAHGATSGYSRGECTYGYDCSFTGDGTSTRLLVFDITNREAPVLERRIDLAGSLITARRVGSAVHTVVTKATDPFGELELEYYPSTPDLSLCNYYGERPPLAMRIAARSAYEDMRARNIAKIEAQAVNTLLPWIVDSAETTPPEGPSCTDLYASAIADGNAYTSIVSVDMQHPGPVKAATIISRSGAIYASADALYMAVPHASAWSSWGSQDLSTIHKFRISDIAGQTRYLASGAVEGRALNQFAMDEKDGFLRIATTDGHAPSPDAVSYMSVLTEQGSDLVKVGQIDGIAPTEDIRSVRFDGTRAFVVTFKKTDPLFTFDLSNPTNPQLLGELKIPGFSTYMHMLDETHLLTIGYDADDHDSFAYFDGVMLQIFDVTDMNNPLLAHKHIIGTRGSSSEALTNHLAFTWYPEYGLLALPMTVCEGGNDGVYGQTMTFNGLMVFDASVASGFAEHGRVPHAVAPDVSCGNWWTNGSSTVKRSLFLDQYVYSVSDSELKVRDVSTLGTELKTVSLQ
jgi:uncharacterized secreted protein with C-terminal beta-propeller domain